MTERLDSQSPADKERDAAFLADVEQRARQPWGPKLIEREDVLRLISLARVTRSAGTRITHPDNIEVMISSLLSVVAHDMREAAEKDLRALVEMASATRSASERTAWNALVPVEPPTGVTVEVRTKDGSVCDASYTPGDWKGFKGWRNSSHPFGIDGVVAWRYAENATDATTSTRATKG